MTLPPPPDSFFEGGKPQSEVAPGDTGRELLHEVKNLAQAVSLLTRVAQKTRTRQKQVIVSTLVSLLALTMAIGYSRYLSVEQTRDRIKANHIACDTDNRRGELEVEILQASLASKPGDQVAMLFFTPRIKAFQGLQKDCMGLYPSPGDAGWPTFFHSGVRD